MPSLTYDEFRETVTGSVQRYLNLIADSIRKGHLRARNGYVHVFPSTLLFTKTDSHYVFELLGSRRGHGPLLVKENTGIKWINRLIGTFNPNADTVYLCGTGTPSPANVYPSFTNLTLTSNFHMEQLEARFPGFATLSPKAQLRSLNTFPSFMALDARGFRTFAINRCYLTSGIGTIVRPRYINFLFGQARSVGRDEFAADLGRHMNIPSDQLMGVAVIPVGDLEAIQLAAEFASLYMQDVQETTLSQFLTNHEEVIKRAFSADRVFFEQSLPWLDGNPDPDEINIRPDLIARKKDGSWTVVDFKLPLLDKSRVTTGKRARRKFIYPINDGISQLFNYADYFNYQKNRDAAAAILGDQFSNPQLALVVGTDENVNLTEVDEAKRSYKPVDIIGYDMLIRLYLNNK